MLFLAGSVAAARADDRQTTTAFLNEAQESASRLGDDANAMWTAFGPTNVAIPHRLISMDWAPHEGEGDKLLFLFDCGDPGTDELDRWQGVSLDHLDRYVVPRIRSAVGNDISASYLEHGELPWRPDRGVAATTYSEPCRVSSLAPAAFPRCPAISHERLLDLERVTRSCAPTSGSRDHRGVQRSRVWPRVWLRRRSAQPGVVLAAVSACVAVLA